MNEKKVSFANMICESAIKNEIFLKEGENACKSFKLIIDIWDYCFEVEVECMKSHYTLLWSTLLHVVQPRLYGMIIALLLGDIPACYIFMRLILEGVIDSVIATTRFPDLQFPQNMNKLKELEREKRLSFAEKCKLLLPAWANSVINDCIKLWNYLSNYWVHAPGIIKVILKKFKEYAESTKEKIAIPPMWGLALPYTYDKEDIKELEELAKHLEKLYKIIRKLLDPYKAKTN